MVYLLWQCFKYVDVIHRGLLPSVDNCPSAVRRGPMPLSPIQSVAATVNAASSTAPDTKVYTLFPVCLP